jgi:hypothetical protein
MLATNRLTVMRITQSEHRERCHHLTHDDNTLLRLMCPNINLGHGHAVYEGGEAYR